MIPSLKNAKMRCPLNRKQRTLFKILISIVFLAIVILGGVLLDEERIITNLNERNSAPSLTHLFGTDWLGRDMFTRTVMGLSLSIGVGLIGAIGSTLIALFLGMAAATMGKMADRLISWIIDLFLSVPHLVTLILIAFTLGGGFKGIVIGLTLTHWPSLARVIRAEVMQVRSAEFVQVSQKMGKTRWWIALHHILPHIAPQLLIGFMLLFPHVILHEAAVTFLGLGLSPHEPAIGIILSESMKYLSSGMWWLAFFPGLCLLIVVRTFDQIGENLRVLMDPTRTHD
ncbi:ABC transporter permease [Viridibacillus sp. FSL R5-0477]|uniref:Binding-protein-dependent transport system inner membrane protein n=1 Tax=Viridibacillus arenosi FSL R5-213 TaxID=1227360 RepID=W4ER69_9BACL|nr:MULTISPECIES: ABC transporter permease [Viridibacillus]ETT83070.1 binding-protein-dependent transport system inner membrane protein [Viridibacillus arenosi FSL R5-213]OMC81992.1 peptide ABC transporter permease [Viridibacillus sp. FSL H8-0123]OMC90945.1 peptide ABC transporter permease [Viridibacillus arenosi]